MALRFLTRPLARGFATKVPGARVAAISNTLNRAMLAIDDGCGATYASCFTKEGRCEVALLGITAEGHTALAQMAEDLHARFPDCRHWEGNVCVIEADEPDEAINRSYWQSLEGGTIVSTGIHYDALEREEGIWKIASRRILHTWTRKDGHVPQAAHDWATHATGVTRKILTYTSV